MPKYYSIKIEIPNKDASVDLNLKFKTYAEAMRYVSDLYAALEKKLDDPKDIYQFPYTIIPDSDSDGVTSIISKSWKRPIGHEVTEALLAALTVLGVCGFVLAVWGLIETIL